MAQTPISAFAPFCTAGQFTARFDWRTAARLLSDTGTPLATQAAVEGSAILTDLLKEASGEIEMACARAGRYSVQDLQTLAATNAGSKLAGLVTDLVVGKLFGRRPDLQAQTPERALRAMELLQQIEHGDRIWPLQETTDAGVMDDLTLDPIDVVQSDGVVIQAGRYFGIRANQLRRDW